MVSYLLLLSQATSPSLPGTYFSVEQARKIVAEWKSPGRYEVSDQDPANPYQVVQSAEGATWLYNYYKKRSPGIRILPTQNPVPQNPTHAAWDQWISRTYESDFARLNRVASSLNQIQRGYFGPPLPEPARKVTAPVPLASLAATPPSFATVIRRQTHHVKLDGYVVDLTDGPALRPGYPYLRFTTGVQHSGNPLGSTQLATLSRQAGLDDSLIRVLQSVSALEGGFDAINTYDTGYVSVGFIQFASLQNGAGSLGRLLATYKRNRPEAFAKDFRRFGIEVNPVGVLVVLDPQNGQEKFGPDAAKKIIEDKRLTAVFQRAGSISQEFQLEQLKLAKQLFDPRSRSLLTRIDGQSQTVPVTSLFKSEAGLATLMDRLINTGSLGDAGTIAASIASEYQVKTVEELAKLEDVLVQRLTYRTDFLASKWLTKPQPSASLVAAITPSNTPAPASMRGQLSAGNAPLPVVPGFNVNLAPHAGSISTKSGNPPRGTDPQNAETTERAEPPVKPDSQVGRPITDIGG